MKRYCRVILAIFITMIFIFSCCSIGEVNAFFFPEIQFDISGYSYEELLRIKETLDEWMKITQIEILEREKQIINENNKENENVVSTEIEFREIPWGSNIPDAVSQFIKFKSPQRHEIYFNSELENAAEVLLYPRDKEDVAGYDISYISMKFLYTVDNGTILMNNENVRLIRAMYYLNAINKDETYDDLKLKLSVLYGEGIEESTTLGIATTWSADDGSYVQLENGYFAVQINYGIKGEIYDLWITEILEEQKRQESEKAEGNYDGL